MSQYRYYDGTHMSAQMKADARRIRAAVGEKRYAPRKVTEERKTESGETVSNRVMREADAVPMKPRARHRFATDKLTRGRRDR